MHSIHSNISNTNTSNISNTSNSNSNNSRMHMNSSPRSTPTGHFPMFDISYPIPNPNPNPISTTPGLNISNFSGTNANTNTPYKMTSNTHNMNTPHSAHSVHTPHTPYSEHNMSTVSTMSNMDISLCLHPSNQIINSILTNKDKIDAILYVANYYKSIRNYKKAENYCIYLLDLHSNEGNEARSILREIRNLKK